VDRVIPKYHQFLETFPTFEALAQASHAKVLTLWSGLGYNSRALRLHRLAMEVVEKHGGVLPKDPETLLGLSGIGPYTAGAVLCFAYELPVTFADVNIERVLTRLMHGPGKILTKKEMTMLCDSIAPTNSTYAYHQALMDLGALFCKASRTLCESCPVGEACVAKDILLKDPSLAAAKKKKASKPFKETQRFVRGRMVEFLRERKEGDTRDALLKQILELEPTVSIDRVDKALQALCQEELIYKEGERYFL